MPLNESRLSYLGIAISLWVPFLGAMSLFLMLIISTWRPLFPLHSRSAALLFRPPGNVHS